MPDEDELLAARRQITSHAKAKLPAEDVEELVDGSLVEALEHYKPERGKFPTFAFLVYKRNFCTYWTKRNHVPNPNRDVRLRKDIDNLEVARLYVRDKLSLVKIARVMNCDPITIMDRLERMGIDRRPAGRSREK